MLFHLKETEQSKYTSGYKVQQLAQQVYFRKSTTGSLPTPKQPQNGYMYRDATHPGELLKLKIPSTQPTFTRKLHPTQHFLEPLYDFYKVRSLRGGKNVPEPDKEQNSFHWPEQNIEKLELELHTE